MFLLSKPTFITMRVEDLDKKFALRNITETVKQLLIINVLFFIGTLAVGDQAYEIPYFPENSGFQFWQANNICLCTAVSCIFYSICLPCIPLDLR
jgi:flagellar biosynthesis protein FlhB